MNTGNKRMTLGSLFDGSGGFPLGGILAGIEPRWGSEIEPFAVLVTQKRLPQVRHYGDVSKLKGSQLEPVDIITFGSPCQDMSIAGRRAGLDGERSGLFYQAIRIIKEMREATHGQYPRYCVWENVPGAFSSNRGEDFRAVLEAVIGVKEEGVSLPAPENHRWAKADVLLGDGWSVAYRVFDAQYWSVPQRRARIYLVADFAGASAGDVLFKSEGMSGYTPQGFRAWEGAAGGAETGAGAAGERADSGSGTGRYCLNPQGCSGVSVTEEQTGTLVAQDHGHHPAVLQSAGFSTEHSAQSRSIGYEEEVSPTLRAGVVPAAMAIESNPTDSRVRISEKGVVQTLTGRMGTGGNNTPLVAQPEPITLKIRCGCAGGGKGPLLQRDKSATLGTNNDQTLFQPLEARGFDRYNGSVTESISHTLDTSAGDNVPMVFVKGTRPHNAQEGQEWKEGGIANTLNTFDVGETRCNELAVVQEGKPKSYGISRIGFEGGEKAAFNFAVDEEKTPTLQCGGPHAVAKPEIRAFGVCSKQSHSMLSDNPHSGFYEAKTSRTLDQGGGNPCCAQGGICVVVPEPESQETYDVRFTSDGTKNARGHCYKTEISRCLDTSEANPDSNHGGIAVVAFTANQRDEVRDLGAHSGSLQAQPGMKQQTFVLQGSMIGREDKNGPQGDGVNEDVSFTLNTVDKHAVAAPTYCATTGSYMTVEKERSNTLMARDWKDPQIVNDTEKPATEPSYIVRRLTPTECARLQGFPDWWCDGLAIPDPSEDELAFWTEVWTTWNAMNGKKAKTEKQIRKWLAKPYTDAAEYKLWGNGISLPVVYFVLSGIVWAAALRERDVSE